MEMLNEEKELIIIKRNIRTDTNTKSLFFSLSMRRDKINNNKIYLGILKCHCQMIKAAQKLAKALHHNTNHVEPHRIVKENMQI